MRKVVQKTAAAWQMKLGGSGGKGCKQVGGRCLLFPLLYITYLMFATKDSCVVLKLVFKEREETEIDKHHL